MKREWTGTVYIVDQEHLLLLWHRKHAKWMPPGGHVEVGELPHECAKREALEETGLEIEFITPEELWVDYSHACSLPRPYMCLLENIPACNGIEAHQHVDFIFVARPCGGYSHVNRTEAADMRWFTLAQVQALTRHDAIYPEVQDTAVLLLKLEHPV